MVLTLGVDRVRLGRREAVRKYHILGSLFNGEQPRCLILALPFLAPSPRELASGASLKELPYFKPSLCKGGCRAQRGFRTKRGGRVVKVGVAQTEQPLRQARSSPATSPCTREAIEKALLPLRRGGQEMRPSTKKSPARAQNRLLFLPISCKILFASVWMYSGRTASASVCPPPLQRWRSG